MLTLPQFRSCSDESLELQHPLVECRETAWTPRHPARERLAIKKRKKRHIPPYRLTSARHCDVCKRHTAHNIRTPLTRICKSALENLRAPGIKQPQSLKIYNPVHPKILSILILTVRNKQPPGWLQLPHASGVLCGRNDPFLAKVLILELSIQREPGELGNLAY